ncbi:MULTISPECIES: DinB family protein [unclassified Mycobacterium]|uniref:DinB family protein n=1 Tax=unclassified Mycobacterium TaxID=2642494 RepID=UPI0009EDC76F|nr:MULTISPECIES: DinB family protein [unclassified Mycobacterium]
MTDRCAGCGFTYDLTAATAAGDDIRVRVTEISEVLRRNTIDVRARPRPGVWSPLEYACHVRDVLLVQRERVLAARRSSGARCTPMGRDERADHEGYNEQEPEAVARQLTDAASLFGSVLERLAAEDWDRTVIYNYPESEERSLRWVAVHTVHDVHHHLHDIRRQVGAAGS